MAVVMIEAISQARPSRFRASNHPPTAIPAKAKLPTSELAAFQMAWAQTWGESR